MPLLSFGLHDAIIAIIAIFDDITINSFLFHFHINIYADIMPLRFISSLSFCLSLFVYILLFLH